MPAPRTIRRAATARINLIVAHLREVDTAAAFRVPGTGRPTGASLRRQPVRVGGPARTSRAGGPARTDPRGRIRALGGSARTDPRAWRIRALGGSARLADPRAWRIRALGGPV